MKYLIIAIGLIISSLAQAQSSRNPCYNTNGANCIGVGNSSPLPVSEFYQKVAEGNVTGYSSVVKIGYNSAVGVTEELIGGTGAATPYMPTAALQFEAVSSSAADGVAGAGVRSIFVTGLDASFNEISELITLNGITPVASIQSFIRVLTAISTSVGTYRGSNVGDVTIRGISGGTTFLIILIGQGTALTSHYTVPSGKSLFLHSFFAAIESTKSAALTFWVGTGADVVSAPYVPILASGRAGGVGATFEQSFNGLTGMIPEKTDIWVTGTATAATASITVEYAYILKTN